MTRLDMEQHTPEWYALRKVSIGASDAPCIMGVGFKTILELWEIKCGMVENDPPSSFMQRGLDLEPEARELFMSITNKRFKPTVYKSNEYDYLIASVDGASIDDRFILEIKCPGAKDHKLACEGKIPTKYYPQLQHQHYVTECEHLFYFSYRPEDENIYSIIEVKRDDAYIAKMLQAEKAFREAWINLTPPTMNYVDHETKDDAIWRALANQYKDLTIKEKLLANEKEHLKEKIEEQAEGRNSVGAGLKLTYGLRKGNIQYGLVPQLKGLDLESYRAKPIKTLNLSFTD